MIGTALGRLLASVSIKGVQELAEVVDVRRINHACRGFLILQGVGACDLPQVCD
jgi:hypothetical protein